MLEFWEIGLQGRGNPTGLPSGGQGGGGTLLTDKGRHMIHSFRLIESEFRTFLDEMTKRTELRQPASAK